MSYDVYGMFNLPWLCLGGVKPTPFKILYIPLTMP